jgi:hypothetical protein
LRKTLTAAAAVLALALAGCTSTEPKNQQNYEPEVKDNFVDTCASAARRGRPEAADRELREDCRCIVDSLEDRIPYVQDGPNNDFKEADRAARDGRPLPGNLREEFDQATSSCAT